MSHITRRDLIRAGAALPFAVSALDRADAAAAPPYTISINIEMMFNTGRGNPPMPKADRIRAVAAKGFKAYSFSSAQPEERAAMLKAQYDTGLKCVGLVGTGNAGGTTGFTKPGAQEALLAEIKDRVEIAKQFGTQPDLISFVGIIQPDVPWETQRAGIIEGLKRAGDIAAAGGVTITRAAERGSQSAPASIGPVRRGLSADQGGQPSEREDLLRPLSPAADGGESRGQPQDRPAGEADQDRADRRSSPGRLEPGTGEINYAFIFKELRRLNWTGYVDTEHGTSSTADHAMDVVRRLSEEN